MGKENYRIEHDYPFVIVETMGSNSPLYRELPMQSGSHLPYHEIIVDPDTYETLHKIDVNSSGLVEIATQHLDGGWSFSQFLPKGEKLERIEE